MEKTADAVVIPLAAGWSDVGSWASLHAACEQDEHGNVTVNGYTDNQPIHTVQFPSNWQLSQARADMVAKTLAGQLSDPRRVHATGKGDTDPVAPNATAEGRQQNRRTDVVLTKTASLP